MPDSAEPRVALYPGSFDPPTYGHLDLIARATRLFDRVIVAVARNQEKATFFSPDERMAMLEEVTADMPRVEIATFEGLTAEYARQRGVRALVRGLRAISDFEFELSMAITNQKINPSIDTVCLMPSEHFLFLSSRVVREVARFGGELHAFVPPVIEARLRERFRQD
jgi:pantetheine-phosphate adenylyltransferase